MQASSFTCPHAVAPDNVPWVPTQEGVAAKPLRFSPDLSGYVLMLRVEPGTVIPRHRHTGEVHGVVLQGQRRLLDTGDVLTAGGYVYEPAGNVDSWMAVGDDPLVCFIVVSGDVEYLGEDGHVVRRSNARSLRDAYLRRCSEEGISDVL